MQIIVNGKPREAPDGGTVLMVLQELKLNAEATIVELNRTVLDKKAFGEMTLADGDQLELVRIVGGG